MSNRRAHRSKMLLSVQAAVALSLPLISAQAQTWLNPVSGNWSVPTNWFGGVAPVSANTTSLTFGGTGYTASNDIGSFSLNSIISNVTGPTTLDGSTLSFGGTNPAITQNGAGAIQVSSALDLSATLTIGGSGAGTVTLAGPITSTPPAVLTTTAGNGLILNNPNSTVVLSGGGTYKQLIQNTGTLLYTGGNTDVTGPGNSGVSTAPVTDISFAIGNVSGQTATATFSGGAFQAGNAYAGHVGGANGILTLTGPTTTFNNYYGGANVGTQGRFGTNAGNGTINVLNSAKVTTALIEIGRSQGSNSYVLVDGFDSKISSQQLVVNRGGTVASTAVIDIKNQGQIRAVIGDASTGGITIGAGTLTTTTVNINNGTLLAEGQLSASGAINAVSTINLSNNGVFETLTGAAFYATATGSAATINVGPTAFHKVVSQFTPAGGAATGGGTSTINIAAGGSIETGANTFAATRAGGVASVNVNGGYWNSLGALLFSAGTAATPAGISTLNINNGGSVSVGSSALFAREINSTSSLLISGANSKLQIATGNECDFATDVNAVATLSVSSGGQWNVDGSSFNATDAGSIARMTINGASSTGLVTGTMYLSGGATPAGTSTLTVSNGASMAIGAFRMSQNDGGVSSFIIDSANVNLDTGFGGTGDMDVAGIFNTTLTATGTVGTLTVQNAGSLIVGGDLNVAPAATGATGTVNALGTGSISVVGDVLAADTSTNAATINVSGGSAELNATGNWFMSAGLASGSLTGSVSVNVSNGGSATGDNMFLATNNGTVNISVDGTNSTLATVSNAGTGNFILSDDPTSVGTMSVTNGGNVLMLDGVGSLSGAMFIAATPGSVANVSMSGSTSGIGANLVQLGGQGTNTLGGSATYTQTGGIFLTGQTHVFATSTVNFNGGTFDVGNLIVDGKINVGAGGVKNIEAATLTINSGGLIDLTNNGMVIDYTAGSLGTGAYVRSNIQSGLSGGTTGIVTSLNPGTGKFGVAYAQVGTGTNELNITTFRGVTVDTSTVVVRGTYNGDINIDGKVDSTDFAKFVAANGYGNVSGTAEWVNGDFNYDGKVTTADFNYIAGNFGSTPLASALPGALLGDSKLSKLMLADLSPELLAKLESDGMLTADAVMGHMSDVRPDMQLMNNLDSSGAPTLGSVVPEPASLSLLALAGAGLAARRRRI